MRTRTLATEAGDVTIREWGHETGQGDRLLLALHSMGPVSTGALYNCAVGPLVAAGYHVVAPDLPGYGRTAPLPPEEYDVALLADRVWQWVEALGAGRITLIGHSWGGAIAMRMQMESPGRLDALVLVDSGHLDYADVNGADANLSLDQWVQRARDRRLVVPDRNALAEAIEIDAADPLMDDLMLGMAEEAGQLVPRVTPEAQGAALFHLGRARQTETWSALAGGRHADAAAAGHRAGDGPRAEPSGRPRVRRRRPPGRRPAGRGHHAQPDHRPARGVRPHGRGLARKPDVTGPPEGCTPGVRQLVCHRVTHLAGSPQWKTCGSGHSTVPGLSRPSRSVPESGQHGMAGLQPT